MRGTLLAENLYENFGLKRFDPTRRIFGFSELDVCQLCVESVRYGADLAVTDGDHFFRRT